MDFTTSLYIAAAGMRAQSGRMRIIAENLANADSVSATGADPYRRRISTITSEFDRELNATVVKLGDPVNDAADFRMQYDPGNPAADKQGYVHLPNVNALVEMMDMRDAQRAYEANLQVMDGARNMLTRTIDLLRR
ncbi:MAG: flagellar basal-body rod protein FlgC [Alphaproteobacteria bacterium]|jgi:flagellar basal-body rod protein FlgC|nr:flagellar basal-body rod protein FlgC [Alphaproteobacteria bacterium]